MKIIAAFRDEETNVEGRAVEFAESYNVVLWDLDADCAAPGATIYPKTLPNARERAVSKAREFAGIGAVEVRA